MLQIYAQIVNWEYICNFSDGAERSAVQEADRLVDALVLRSIWAVIPLVLVTTALLRQAAAGVTTQKSVETSRAPLPTILLKMPAARTVEGVACQGRTADRTCRVCCGMAGCRRWSRACGPKWYVTLLFSCYVLLFLLNEVEFYMGCVLLYKCTHSLR